MRNQSIAGRFSRSILAAVLVASTCALVFGASAEDPATVEELDARIAAIEASLIQSQAEMFRAKHGIEFGDPSLASERTDLKTLEKEVLDARKEYDDRLRSLDEGYRRGQSSLERKYKQLQDLTLLAETIDRETGYARDRGGEGVTGTVAALEVELSVAKNDRLRLHNEIETENAELDALRAELTSRDPRAAELKAWLDSRQALYDAAFESYQGKIKDRPELDAIDQKRRDLAAELQRLRAAREKLAAE
jgi:chromosome segregation ATPase